MYANLGKTDEAMALGLNFRAYIAAELGQREIALSAMEEEAAKRADPHDRADLYWQTYIRLGMYDEAREVLSDLWYGYAAEDIGPKMDYADAFTFVELLRADGRTDEAAPIAKELADMIASDDNETVAYKRMLEGEYEEALRLFIELARDGKPSVDFLAVNTSLFALKQFPEYATLEKLTEDWRKEQRALYDELMAARTSSKDAAHP